jgi:hypothetical protein
MYLFIFGTEGNNCGGTDSDLIEGTILAEGLKRTMEKDSRSSDWDLNPRPPQYEKMGTIHSTATSNEDDDDDDDYDDEVFSVGEMIGTEHRVLCPSATMIFPSTYFPAQCNVCICSTQTAHLFLTRSAQHVAWSS